MRLVQIKVRNFRCFREEIVVDMDDITVFVGKNDSGKSSLLDAIDIFFSDRGIPEPDDLSVHSTDGNVGITCVFESLPATLVLDEQHPTDLAKEHLLSRARRLEVVKAYDCSGSKGKLTGIYARALHPTAEGYHDLLSLTNAKLKQRAKELKVDLSGVNQTINTDLRRAIWAHCGDLQPEERDVELKTEAAGRVWEQLRKSMPVFALFRSDRPSTDQDAEAQDPMKAAVKQAIKAQEAALTAIAETVRTEVQEIATRTVEKIREMDPELASQLTPRVTNKNWDSLFSVSLTGDEDIPVNKRGSGTRRLILLNFFRAKAEQEAEDRDTGVIYAIEEPETSQHPNHQKLLIDAFEDLAVRPGCQVFLTTHTPVLARRFRQQCLRHVTRDASGTPSVQPGTTDETLRAIQSSLGVLPDHSIKVFLGVEGRNDIDFLCGISAALRTAGEDVPDLRQAEVDGHLVFIPLGGSSMDLWISRLEKLNRPEFYLMDRDNPPPQKPKNQDVADALAARGCTVWVTEKRELENYVHPSLIKAEYPNYPGTGDAFEDVPSLFAQAVHEASESGVPWAEVARDLEKLGRKVSQGKRRLNTEFVRGVTPDRLTATDSKDEVRTWLRSLGAVLSAR